MEVDGAGMELELRLAVRDIGSLLVLRNKTEVCFSSCGRTFGSQLTRTRWRHDPPAACYEPGVRIEDDDVLQVNRTARRASVIIRDGHDYRVNARGREGMC